jgi:hypothetical protein
MSRGLVTLAALAAAAALPAAALAKGPAEATLAGPGLDGPVAFTGSGAPGGSGPLSRLVELTGFFPAVFGQSPSPMLPGRPARDLGPRYTLKYDLGGKPIGQYVYPYAEPEPVVFTPAGQPYFDGARTIGGWYAGSRTLEVVLVEAGVPATRPRPGAGTTFWRSPGGFAVESVLVATLLGAVGVLVHKGRFGAARKIEACSGPAHSTCSTSETNASSACT